MMFRIGRACCRMAEISAADAVRFYAPVAYRVRTYGPDVSEAGQTWVNLILSTPAMQQWEAEAPAESWREVGHQEELAACGAITADYRSP